MIQKLNQIIAQPITNGIVVALSQFNYDWLNADNAIFYNMLYHGNHSGQKYISPLVESLLNNKDKLSDDDVNALALAINAKFALKWSKLYQTTIQEYNIIHNYDLNESENIDNDVTRNENTTSNNDVTVTNTGKDSRTLNETETDTSQVENNVNKTLDSDTKSDSDETRSNQYFGFDSATAVPNTIDTTDATTTTEYDETTIESSTTTSTDEVTRSNTDVLDKTNTETTEQNSTSTNNTTDVAKTIRQLTRQGNIGVTTTQQMLQAERELWEWLLIDTVFRDLDTVLTLQIY